MHIGCCAYSYRDALKSGDMDLTGFLDLAGELGLDGVELTSYFFASTDDDYIYKLKRHALKRGLMISGAAVGNRFTFADPEQREKQIADVKTWLDVASRLGAPYLRVFAGPSPDGRDDEAFTWTVEALRACVPTARSMGVLLALENHGGITATVEQVLQLVDAVDSEWLAVNLDTGNYKTSPYESIARTVPHAVCAHVKTEVSTPEGKAKVDTRRVLGTLHDAGYKGFLNIEYEADEDPKTAVPRFVAELRETLAALA